MQDLVVIVLKIAAVLLLVALNGFFVCAEFAIVKVRSTQIQSLIARGSRRARLAQRLVKHLDAYLSATQLGITIASLALGWLGKPFVADLLRTPLQWVGVTGATAVDSISFAVAFTIITFLHIVLGELAPKSIAIRKPEQSTLLVAFPLTAFYKLMYPAIWSLNHAANWLLRLIGIDPAAETDLAHSEEELRMLLARGRVPEIGRTVALSALELAKRTARQVMLPRTEIVYLSTRCSLAENLAIADESNHTRFPLCGQSLDDILGLIHIKDLHRRVRKYGDQANLLDCKREMLFVPETSPLDKLLHTFQSQHVHMAILVDEFGGTVGLVTLEDIVEEVIGELQDEFDREPTGWTQVGEHEYRVDGAFPLHELGKTVGAKFEATDVTSLGGYVLQKAGYLPGPGEKVNLGVWECKVLKSDGRCIQQVLLKQKGESR